MTLHSRGFTLVELIITISMLSILAAAGSAAFSAGMRSAAKTKRYGRMVARGQAALQTIARDIRAAVAHDKVRLTALDREYEGKDADTIDFIAVQVNSYPTEPDASGRCEIGYYIDNDPATDARWLIRRVDRTLDDDALEGGIAYAIGPGVTEINLGFYDGMFWTPEWDDLEQLPAAVRIRIVVKDVDKIHNEVDEDENAPTMVLSTTVPIMACQGAPQP